MSATNGLMRGIEVIDMRVSLSVPIGGATLERIISVFGEPVDNLGFVDAHTIFLNQSAFVFIQLFLK